jgi:hypothetical protein
LRRSGGPPLVHPSFSVEFLQRHWPMRLRTSDGGWPRLLLTWSGLAASYAIVGRLGLLLAVPPGYATAIFPPAGIAVSAMLVIGADSLPGTYCGSLLLNAWVGYSIARRFDPARIATALVIAAASVLQAALAGSVLRRAIGYPARFDNGRDLLRFFLLTPAACLTSATLSLSGMWALGEIEPPDLATSWLTWWIGDTLGVLVVLPLMLVFAGEPRPLWRRRAPYVAVPVILFFALFVAIFSRVSNWEKDQSLLEFRMRAQHLTDVVQARLEEQSVFLEQLGSAFLGRRDPLTRQDFRALVGKLLQRFPTIQAVEWAPRVAAAGRAAFEVAQRREIPGSAVRERDAAGAQRSAGPRAYFYPVTYLAPLAGNREAVGYDLASDAKRRAAIEATIASGQTAATAPVRLVQEHGHQAGILLICATSGGPNGPGVVLVVLRMGTFTENLLAPLAAIMTARLVDAAAARPLFDDLRTKTKRPSFAAAFGFGGRPGLFNALN